MKIGCAVAAVMLLVAGANGAVIVQWSNPSPPSGVPNSYNPALAVTALTSNSTTTPLNWTSNGWSTRTFSFQLTVPSDKELVVTDWSASMDTYAIPLPVSLSTTGAGSYSLGSSSFYSDWGVNALNTVDTSPDVTLSAGTYTFNLWFNLGDFGGGWVGMDSFTINGAVLTIPEPASLSLLALGGLALLRRRKQA